MARLTAASISFPLSLLAAALVSGCSLFGGDSSSSGPGASSSSDGSSVGESDLPVDSRITSVTRKKIVDGLAVAWEVPSEPTDGFIIRYGSSPQSLDTEISVSVSELRREQDPVYGPVYRYIIEDVPGGKPMFVSIAARRGDSISEFTPTMSENRQSAVEF